jgi:hypothetical protein
MLGPYEIETPLAAGGMGEVYRALDRRLGRAVAVKTPTAGLAADPEAVARFDRENRTTAALSHPNILAVYDVGQHDGIPYAVLELLEGERYASRRRVGCRARLNDRGKTAQSWTSVLIANAQTTGEFPHLTFEEPRDTRGMVFRMARRRSVP